MELVQAFINFAAEIRFCVFPGFISQLLATFYIGIARDGLVQNVFITVYFFVGCGKLVKACKYKQAVLFFQIFGYFLFNVFQEQNKLFIFVEVGPLAVISASLEGSTRVLLHVCSNFMIL